MFTELIVIFASLAFLIFYLNQRKSLCKLPPGPLGLPFVGYLPFLGPVPCRTVSHLSAKWGPIFTLKLGEFPVVFVHDFDMVKELYKLDVMCGRAHLPLFEKRGIYGLGLLEGEGWKEVRRFTLRCLKDFGFGKRSMEASILEEVAQTITFIKKNLNEPLYLKPLIELAVINALWFLMTSEKYDIEDPRKRRVTEIMSEGLSDQNIVGIAAFLPWLAKLLPTYSGYGKALQYFTAPEDLAKNIVQKHVADYIPGEERDFIDHALAKIYATQEPTSMFYKEVGMKNLHYTLIDLFFAGSDTMSSTLGWALLYLSLWPDKQVKVQTEIDTVIGGEGEDRLPCLEDRARMPYTEATMHEVMRFSTMVPFGLLHKSLEDVPFGDYVFPKGTFFLTNLYHIFKDPDYWGDPEVFRPERFLHPGSDGMPSFRKDERLIPFSTGKRNCIGENLAMSQYFLFLTGLLANFSFELDPGQEKPDIGPRSGFVLPPPKHLLIITKRQK